MTLHKAPSMCSRFIRTLLLAITSLALALSSPALAAKRPNFLSILKIVLHLWLNPPKGL